MLNNVLLGKTISVTDGFIAQLMKRVLNVQNVMRNPKLAHILVVTCVYHPLARCKWTKNTNTTFTYLVHDKYLIAADDNVTYSCNTDTMTDTG